MTKSKKPLSNLDPYRIFSNLKDDLDSAKLRLSFLKENFQYQDDYRELYKAFQGANDSKPGSRKQHPRIKNLYFGSKSFLEFSTFLLAFSNRFEINHPIRFVLNRTLSYLDLLNLLDPNKDFGVLNDDILKKVLPRMFYKHGVIPVEPIDRGYHFPKYIGSENFEALQLKPYERLLKVNLRKKKRDLIEEFETVLDVIDKDREVSFALGRDNEKDYNQWIADNSRKRKEAWGQLEVWKLRKQRKSFWWISKELGISEDVAKKRFYRVFELIQGKKYDPEFYRKKAWQLKKDDLLKTCDNCDDKECLDSLAKGKWNPCPEILEYIDQDQISLKEKFLKEDSDDFKDRVSFKE